MRLEECKQCLAWEIRTSEKVRGMDFGGGEEGRSGWRAVFGLSIAGEEFWALQPGSLCIPVQPTWATYSYLPHPSRPPHSIRLQARVHTRVSRQAAANHLPLALREIPPTPPQEASSCPFRIVHAFFAG
jgi:hypothetical protein